MYATLQADDQRCVSREDSTSFAYKRAALTSSDFSLLSTLLASQCITYCQNAGKVINM